MQFRELGDKGQSQEYKDDKPRRIDPDGNSPNLPEPH
jgi:hypothetical protein